MILRAKYSISDAPLSALIVIGLLLLFLWVAQDILKKRNCERV